MGMRELQLPELQLIQAVVRFSGFFGEAAQHLRFQRDSQLLRVGVLEYVGG